MTVRLEPQLLRTALRDLALVGVTCLAAVGFDFTLQSTLVRVAACWRRALPAARYC